MASDTLAQTRSRVRDWLGATGQPGRVADSVIDDCIDLAIQDIYSLDIFPSPIRHLWSGVIGVGSERFGFGGDDERVLWTKLVWFEGGASTAEGGDGLPHDEPVPLTLVPTIEEFRELYPLEAGDTTIKMGVPAHYIRTDVAWLCRPAVARAGQFRTDCLSLPAILGAGADPGPQTVLGPWDAIVFGALTYLTLYAIEDPRSGSWQRAYDRSKNNLISTSNRMRTAGRPLSTNIPG